MNIAVITGASSGIGKDFAVLLDERGLDEIWVIARRKELLEQLAKQLKTPCRIFSLDLTDKGNIARYKQSLIEVRPNVSYMVNCSGFGKFGRYDEIDVEQSALIVDLNARALMLMSEVTLPYMKEGSRLINVSSVSSFVAVPYLNVYAATKAFVTHYCRALAVELKPKKINVTAVCPYWMETEFFDRALREAPQHFPKEFKPIVKSMDVAKCALRDSDKGKLVSTYGRARLLKIACKLLPHKLVIGIYMKGQR